MMLNNAAHFIFDSEHLDDIESKLYGFYITENGMFSGAIPDEDIIDATGAWVLVRRTGDSIIIEQDSNGCFGFFIYREGDYWALSNSFNPFLDFLKLDHKLTLNQDYARTYLAQQLCISAYGETIIREIKWLDRRARIHINLVTGALTIFYRRLGEKTILIDTEDGIRLLDAWHDKWAAFINKAAYSWPGNINVDITGGFDSRIVLVPFMSSEINYNRVKFNSHLHRTEDYRIASMLAERFGFSLNTNPDSEKKQEYHPIESFIDRALEDILFEKEIYTPNNELPRVPTIGFSGFGGGILRNYYEEVDCIGYINKTLKLIPKEFKKNKGIRNGIENLLRSSFNDISLMLEQSENISLKGGITALQFYMETRNRSHFAMSIARSCLSQYYNPAILFDPLLTRICTPKNYPLLTDAVIFTRYHQGLINVPIEGGRRIPKKTIKLAEELNRLFPKKREAVDASSVTKDSITWSVMKNEDDIVNIAESSDKRSMREQLSNTYESPLVRNLFEKYLGESSAPWINPDFDKRHPDANKYATVAIAKVICDIELGRDAPKNFAAFLEACKQ